MTTRKQPPSAPMSDQQRAARFAQMTLANPTLDRAQEILRGHIPTPAPASIPLSGIPASAAALEEARRILQR